MIDLHTTQCTYFERVWYSGPKQTANGNTAKNHHTNVWDGLFDISEEARQSIIQLRQGIDSGNIVVSGREYGDKQKAKFWCIPMITGNCVTSTDSHADIVKPNNLIFLDIDSTEDVEEVKRKVNALPYTVLSAESVSGHGIFAVFAADNIADEDDYKRCFWAAMNFLGKQGLADCGKAKLDSQCSNLNRPRYVTIDPHPYYNPDAEVWTERCDKKDLPVSLSNSRNKTEKKKRIIRTSCSDEIMNEYWAADTLTDFKNKHIDLVRNVPYRPALVPREGRPYTEREGGVNWAMCRDYVIDNHGNVIGCNKWKTELRMRFDISCSNVKHLHPDITADEFLLTMLQEFLTYYEVPHEDKRITLSMIERGWRSQTQAQSMKKGNYGVSRDAARERGVRPTSLTNEAGMWWRRDHVYNPAEHYDPSKSMKDNLEGMVYTSFGRTKKIKDSRTVKRALHDQGQLTAAEIKERKMMEVLLLIDELRWYDLDDSIAIMGDTSVDLTQMTSIASYCGISRPTVYSYLPASPAEWEALNAEMTASAHLDEVFNAKQWKCKKKAFANNIIK